MNTAKYKPILKRHDVPKHPSFPSCFIVFRVCEGADPPCHRSPINTTGYLKKANINAFRLWEEVGVNSVEDIMTPFLVDTKQRWKHGGPSSLCDF